MPSASRGGCGSWVGGARSQAVHAPADPRASNLSVPAARAVHEGSAAGLETDSRSIGRRSGCMSLVAVLEWCSRSVVAWAVSLTRPGGFCVEALARLREVAQPELCHRDPGAPLTSDDFTSCLAAAGMQMRMDGRGRALDHIVGERLWRSVT